MRILFPANPMRAGEVDVDYADEHAAAQAAGFACDLMDHELLVRGQAAKAIRRIQPTTQRQPCWYRGWMVSGEQYAALEAELQQVGYDLTTRADAYGQAHYLPRAYPILAGLTPETVWTDSPDEDAAWQAYQSLAGGDVIVKDWVKSAKHLWNEACFLPADSGRERVLRTIRALKADRGDLFEKGFVFRRYVPVVTTGRDMRGHPVTDELRLIYVNGRVLIRPQAQFQPPPDVMAEIDRRAGQFQSRLITLDVSPLTDGRWTIIESGDAGVSGLPVSLLAETFYTALRNALVTQP